MKRPAYKLHLKKDDIVQVIAGKEKGKKGKILAIFPVRERVTVEKLNMVKRHTCLLYTSPVFKQTRTRLPSVSFFNFVRTPLPTLSLTNKTLEI